MTQSVLSLSLPQGDVLGRLRDVCHEQGAPDLASRLADLRSFIADDLRMVEAELGVLDGGAETPAYQSAHHLLRLDGKRLRPMCVLIASRMGGKTPLAARDLAVAAELVHSATLLHDDVVDEGEMRRGKKAARVVYGNAASIFGGDWLLVEALGRIHRGGMPSVLEAMLDVLREMLLAESFQLASRGRATSIEDYFFVAEGKTASLFRWALFAGARAAELPERQCRALATFGQKLGVAFQIVDDVLDVSGDPRALGKSLFADLREGKMTYPMLLAVERDATFGALVSAACASEGELPEEAFRRAALAIAETGAASDALARAHELADEAMAELAVLPRSVARTALTSVALGVVNRSR